MALLRPFQALRPIPEKAAQVAAVPYDVVNREESVELAKGNPWSFLHISRSEICLPAETDPYSERVYSKARENFNELIKSCPMLTENEPRLYIYRLKMGSRQQTGIFATFSIDEYDRNLIKKHERTRKDKEDDRTRHLLALDAQTGPVFLAYRGMAEINEAVDQIVAGKPLYDFTAPDGVTHTLWSTDKVEKITDLFKKVPALYIADGHHRAASASRARAEKASKNPNHLGSEAYNYVLAVAFPAEQLKILPYNRVIKDLNGLSAAGLLDKLEEKFVIQPNQTNAEASPNRGEFSMYLGGKWYGLKPKSAPSPSPSVIASLDVSILQDNVLAPILGIHDPRTDKRIDFVGGIRGTAELIKLVDSGQFAVAFSMHPTSLDDLIGVSDAGEIMPPKSTWFEPKLRDGLLSHLLS
jgi:uncharacterized protein (DUF1015 family)